jgi:Acetyltransferase (GNAT) domain
MKESSKMPSATYSKQNLTVLVFKNEPSAIEQFEFTEPIWLFNTSKHVDNQSSSLVFTFILTDTLQKRASAFFHLFIENQLGVSPLRASFGSFEIAENVNELGFDYLLKTIENVANEQNLADITIKHYPSCYDEIKSVFIKAGLLKNGFEYHKALVNQHISISAQPFETHLHYSEKRRLRKCERAAFQFEEWTNPNVETVYDFIAQNRHQLGYSITFSLAELRNWFAIFPESFQVFCVRDQDQIAALTLTVRVGESVLYHFCPANNLAYRTFSPAVLLTKGLYDYCLNNQLEILDLGVSLDSDGNVKPSLARFKQNLGAEVSEKIIFKKVY